MIYLDSAATSFPKLSQVKQAVQRAMDTCANPGRGGHRAAMEAAQVVYSCRERAGRLFDCQPEQVVFTSSCTHGLNMAIRSLFQPGDRVVISGFEHNAVTRPLHALGVQTVIAGRKLFDPEDTLAQWERALRGGVQGAVCTHCSNVFGYILPIERMVALCRSYGVPCIIDAAQSAGTLPISLRQLGADFIAMPGHKGLLGPMGTGLLLCGRQPKPLICGGTGSMSESPEMPPFLPDGAEAGTLNVPGIAGLGAGLAYLERVGVEKLLRREHMQLERCVKGLEKLEYRVFYGRDQCALVSFVPKTDCETLAQHLANRGVAVRAGLHCAPLAHESAGTLQTGTVRVSFGHACSQQQTDRFLNMLAQLREW